MYNYESRCQKSKYHRNNVYKVCVTSFSKTICFSSCFITYAITIYILASHNMKKLSLFCTVQANTCTTMDRRDMKYQNPA